MRSKNTSHDLFTSKSCVVIILHFVVSNMGWGSVLGGTMYGCHCSTLTCNLSISPIAFLANPALSENSMLKLWYERVHDQVPSEYKGHSRLVSKT